MIRLLPLLCRPAALSFKNSWLKQSFANKQFWRDILVLGCICYLLFGLYKLSSKGFGLLFRHHELTAPYLPSIFNLLILALMLLIFFSSCSFSLTSLFMSEDLELLMASPISKRRLFLNKFLQILGAASWIVCLGSIPCAIALSRIYHSGDSFWLALGMLVVPVTVTPVGLAICTTTLISRFLSGRHLRILLPILSVCLLLLVFSKSHTFFESVQKKDIHNVVELLASLKSLEEQAIPVSSLGKYISDSLLGAASSHDFTLPAFYLLSLLSFGLSYLLFCRMHNAALTRVRHSGSNLNLSSRKSQKIVTLALPYLERPFRAIMLKEFKIFARDFSHLLQISVVLIICLFYLYNFQSIFNSKSYFTTTLTSWQFVCFLCNIAFGSLIIISLCTRFVYTSISLEGHSLWILASSPLSYHGILQRKFRTWYPPVALFAGVIFVSGCFALQSEEYFIFLTFIISLISAYSLTALAICLGSVFANFTWVHNSQIFASAGSFLFISSALFLTMLNLSLLGSLLFMSFIRNEFGFSALTYTALQGSLSGVYVLGNYYMAKSLLRIGARHLEQKVSFNR